MQQQQNLSYKQKPELKIIKSAPRGFCAGVVRAIQIVEGAIEKYGPPVYVRHEIVHNKHVVDDLRKKGAVFIDDIKQIPLKHRNNKIVIFSAHGVSKKIILETQKENIEFINAVCPLVSKVHNQAIKYYQQGLNIILIGHRGHPEVSGTIGQLPKGAVNLIENEKQAQQFNCEKNSKIAILTQTTLSLDDTKNIIAILKQKFPNVTMPSKDDICYATTNRQKAVAQIAPICDAIIVMGANNSSNSCRLVEVAKKAGCPKTDLISNVSEIIIENYIGIKTLGISAGASAPEFLINQAIETFEKYFRCDVCETKTITENITFKLPEIIRKRKL